MTDPDRDAAIAKLAEETAAQWRFLGWLSSDTDRKASNDAYERAIRTAAIAAKFGGEERKPDPGPQG